MKRQKLAEVQCNECGSTNVVRAGFNFRKRMKVQRYRCMDCLKVFNPKDGIDEPKS